VEGRLLLDVVVRQGPAIFELFSSKDQSLLLWWDALFVLDFGLHVLDRIIWLDVQSDRFPGQGLDKNLHSTTSKSENKMESRFLLDVVVREGSSIFKLLACENESLLLWGNAFLVLDLGLHVLDGVIWFHVQSDSFSSQGFDENLHCTTSKSEDKVKRGFLLNVVVRQSSAVFKLLSCENKALLLRWDAFLVLNLRLDVLDGIVWLNVQRDGLSGQGFDEDLHGSTAKTKDKVKGGLLLDVVI